jgi:hypothetical protein
MIMDKEYKMQQTIISTASHLKTQKIIQFLYTFKHEQR